MLQRVMTAFPSRLQECKERHGGHTQSVILIITTAMNPHGHGMQPMVFIKFFHFILKIYLI
jgi:hypothetical protein